MVKKKDNAEAPFAKVAWGKQSSRRFAEGKRGGKRMEAFRLTRAMKLAMVAVLALGGSSGPSASTDNAGSKPAQPPFMSAVAGPAPRPADGGPPPGKNGGG